MEEKVDIIDPSDKVIGTISKTEAHTKGLLHRCVIAELRDSKGNWIFVRQSSLRQDIGQLASASGGHIQSGETNIKALKREVFEELGISKFKFVPKGKIIFNREVSGHIENHLFIVYEITSDQIPILNEESDEYVKYTTRKLKKELKENPQIFGEALKYIFLNIYPEI